LKKKVRKSELPKVEMRPKACKVADEYKAYQTESMEKKLQEGNAFFNCLGAELKLQICVFHLKKLHNE